MGIRLYVEENGGERRVVDLKEAVAVIGRGPDNQVVLRDQRSSRKHCRISETPQGVILEDLQSANGTLLNGRAVSRSFLSAGDEIRVGATKFVYQPLEAGGEGGVEGAAVAERRPSGVEPERAAPRPEEPARRRPAAAAASSASRSASPDLPPTERVAREAASFLECTRGPLKGKTFPLESFPVILGRSRQCHIRLRDPRISTQHAQIVREGGRLFIEDLGSTNGVLVDGEKVERAALVTGTRMVIGGFVFRATVAGTRPIRRPKAPAGRPAESAPAESAEELVISKADMERFFAEEKVQQPIIAGALVVIMGLLSYFTIDIAQRLLVEKELDPPRAENRIAANWSFEERPEEDAPANAGPVPGWGLAEGDRGRLEITGEQAQFPGQSALRLTSAGDTDLCAAVYDEAISLGVERRFVLEGYVGNRGAFFAALLVEWLRRSADGTTVVARSFSEATQGRDAAIDVYRTLEPPGDSTHARISCVIYGRGGSAVFDQISFAAAGEDATAEAALEDGTGRRFRVGDGDDGGTVRLKPEGDFELTSGRRRLLPSFWASLDESRDPLRVGPRLVPPVFESGDRGAVHCASEVPDVTQERWAMIQSTVGGTGSECRVRWQLVSKSDSRPYSLVVYFESRDGSVPVLVHDSGTQHTTFAEVRAQACEEIVLGRRESRTSLVFSTPVALSSGPHPVVDGTWVLTARVPAAERELALTFLPGSRREKQAAIALLREAGRLYQEGSIAKAWAALERLPRLYPDQEREIAQSAELLRDWKAEAQKIAAEFTESIARLRENPVPVVYESLVARGKAWERRFQGTEIGRTFATRIAELEGFWDRLHGEREAAEQAERLELARRHFGAGRYGLCELYLRTLLDAGVAGDLERNARRLLGQLEGRREVEVRRILLRRE